MATTPKKNSDKSLIEILADIIDGPGSPEEDSEREARVAEAEHAAVMRKNEERDAQYAGAEKRADARARGEDPSAQRIASRQASLDAEYAAAERAPAEAQKIASRQAQLDSEYAAAENSPTATPPPEGDADTGFAAALEATLLRTKDIADRASASVKASGEASATRANMEKIGNEAADAQRLAAMDNKAEGAFAAAEAALAPAQEAAVAQKFSTAEGEAAFNAESSDQANNIDDAVLAKDFQVTHGGAFDPNSSADAAKMAQIRKARAQNPKASPTQLALMIYRNQV